MRCGLERLDAKREEARQLFPMHVEVVNDWPGVQVGQDLLRSYLRDFDLFGRHVTLSVEPGKVSHKKTKGVPFMLERLWGKSFLRPTKVAGRCPRYGCRIRGIWLFGKPE